MSAGTPAALNVRMSIVPGGVTSQEVWPPAIPATENRARMLFGSAGGVVSVTVY
jgi:hypothetical protein